jgi:hypothetical protein
MITSEKLQETFVPTAFKLGTEEFAADAGGCLQLPEEQQAQLIVGLRKVDVPVLATPVAHG